MLVKETTIFLQSCLLGAVLGFCYDGLRIFRIAIKCHSFVIAIQDILYCVLAAILTFSFVLAYHHGALRVYILAGELLGAVVYFFTISIVLLKISKFIIWLIKKILYILLFPFIWIIRLFKKLFMKLFKGIWKKMKGGFTQIRTCKRKD